MVRLVKNGFVGICLLLLTANMQAQHVDTLYKKRVLEHVEIDFLTSYYSQDGSNASVTGGVGTEELTDLTPTLVISIPLNDDDVLTIDGGISAYTSASSSNLDPFDLSGASGGYDDDDDDDGMENPGSTAPIVASPWVESSGESSSDTWTSLNISYTHSSDDRNSIYTVNGGVSSEYDYFSINFGGSYTKLFNEKNTEIGIKANVFLDKWNPVYPTEMDSYLEANQNLNNGFFSGIEILNQNGQIIQDKNGPNSWKPLNNILLTQEKRNAYALSLSLSQIISKRAQFSLFADVIMQDGWLANPMQRVYFADRPNYYVGSAAHIPNYTNTSNTEVFHLADDIERLPDSRFKIPIGGRLNYYVNEWLVVKTYYRYYSDDWGVQSHTASLELPIKLGSKFTLKPSYRYYTQTAADYFAPYDTHLSTSQYYTSDYDLSEFNANQFSLGVSYTDVFTKTKLWKLGIKSVDLRFSQYDRNTDFSSWIASFGIKLVLDK